MFPNYLVVFNVAGKDEPKAPSLHIKPKDPKPFVTPSPGAYNPVSYCSFVHEKVTFTVLPTVGNQNIDFGNTAELTACFIITLIQICQ